MGGGCGEGVGGSGGRGARSWVAAGAAAGAAIATGALLPRALRWAAASHTLRPPPPRAAAAAPPPTAPLLTLQVQGVPHRHRPALHQLQARRVHLWGRGGAPTQRHHLGGARCGGHRGRATPPAVVIAAAGGQGRGGGGRGPSSARTPAAARAMAARRAPVGHDQVHGCTLGMQRSRDRRERGPAPPRQRALAAMPRSAGALRGQQREWPRCPRCERCQVGRGA